MKFSRPAAKPPLSFLSVAGDRIALVGRDSTDVPVVRVFRIPR